jgi:hypothetical protein
MTFNPKVPKIKLSFYEYKFIEDRKTNPYPPTFLNNKWMIFGKGMKCKDGNLYEENGIYYVTISDDFMLPIDYVDVEAIGPNDCIHLAICGPIDIEFTDAGAI